MRSATFGPMPFTDKQLEEELTLGRLHEPVQLQRVLAHVQVGVQRDLRRTVGGADRRRRRGDEITDAADVDDEPVRRVRHGLAPKARDHPAILSRGGASAWQIATASASAA